MRLLNKSKGKGMNQRGLQGHIEASEAMFDSATDISNYSVTSYNSVQGLSNQFDIEAQLENGSNRSYISTNSNNQSELERYRENFRKRRIQKKYKDRSLLKDRNKQIKRVILPKVMNKAIERQKAIKQDEEAISPTI